MQQRGVYPQDTIHHVRFIIRFIVADQGKFDKRNICNVEDVPSDSLGNSICTCLLHWLQNHKSSVGNTDHER